MGYGTYRMSGWNPRTKRIETRESGYHIMALCDVQGCFEVIDRGLAYRCGDAESAHYTGGVIIDEDGYGTGCGAYTCVHHEGHHDCPNSQYEVHEDDR